MTQIRLHYHTRDEITEKARSGSAVVVPLAATEQHGPHLPVFTDSLICEHIAAEAVRQAAESVPVLVSPVLTIGCSHHHLNFGGTLSYTSATYLQMLRDIGESLITDGFQKIIFLNAHGGNDPIMMQTANDLAVRYPVWTAAASYWSISRSALTACNAAEVGMVPGHAGGFETAAILALHPELVRTERFAESHISRPWINSGPAGTFIGKHKELTGFDGYTDAPNKATAELGSRYLGVIAGSVSAWLVSTIQAMTEGGN
ncbi:creatininase family protein [Paenibacillus spongiae]|uniref:Creatininase family protein n=1 Tax=Paenibacillus spongiae TaxID=2909671 RepID=A0ABY5S801_9BACL|nr:creatininase family protein [Paenibacillus spongiae]UVI29648.1 creatininase family protein [Paenibacillus spongiae]